MGASVMALTPRRESPHDAINQHEPMLELILGRKILQTTSICVFQFQNARELAVLEQKLDNTSETAK